MTTWYLTRKTPNQLGATRLPLSRTGMSVSGDEYTILGAMINYYGAIMVFDAPNECVIEFDIKRVLQDASHEVILYFYSPQAAGPILRWNTTTGVWTLTSGSPYTNCGTVGANTWCHVKCTINRATNTVTIQVDANDARTRVDADVADCYGFYFPKLEGQANPNETFIKNITVNYARPVSTSADLLVWSSVGIPLGGYANTSYLGSIIGTVETKDGVDYAISPTSTNTYILHAEIVSGVIIRCTTWIPTNGFMRLLFSASSSIILSILGGNIRLGSQVGSIITTYTPDQWNTFDVSLTTSGTNTSVNVRVNGGDWGTASTTTYDFPLHSNIRVEPYAGYDPVWFGPNVYLLNEGYITPTLTSPSDISMTEGDAETLSWTPTGDGGTYTVTKDGDIVASGAWTSGVAITYDLSSEDVGIYSFICTITDMVDTITDTVAVTVTALISKRIIDFTSEITPIINTVSELVKDDIDFTDSLIETLNFESELMNDTIDYTDSLIKSIDFDSDLNELDDI